MAQAFGERSRYILSPFPAAQFCGCTAGAPRQADGDRPEPQEVLAKKPACSLVGKVSLGLQLPSSTPLQLWLPVTGGGWSATSYFCSVLCSVHGPGGVLC